MKNEHQRVLEDLQSWLEKPMLVLSFAWIVLLVVEYVRGLDPLLRGAGVVIWALFFAEFAVSLAVAPDKTGYLRANWLKALALLAPALRVLRLARIARIARFGRATRGLRLLRVVSSVNTAQCMRSALRCDAAAPGMSSCSRSL